jgi:hypothetical protein
VSPRELTEHQAARAAFGLAAASAGTLEDADPQMQDEMQRLAQGATIVASPPVPVVEVEPLPEAEMSEAERELRAWCLAHGEAANPKIIAEMRSDEWQQRQERNAIVFHESVEAWTSRYGGRWSETVPPVAFVTAPSGRSTSREQRTRRRASAPTRGSPDDSDLPLAVIAPEAFRATVERALGGAA